MEITNRGIASTSVPQPQVDAAASASGDQPVPSVTPNASTYTPSSELVRLLDQVRAQPEVREDRVQAATERLQQGYYNSQTSIDQTAQAMIRAGD
jgi:hypothetical protein